MRRVKSNEDWSLMCPNECPGLAETWGEEFERLYEQYEKEGRAKKVVKAQKLWFSILEAQTETGTPYMLYKDACNRKSNQQVPKLSSSMELPNLIPRLWRHLVQYQHQASLPFAFVITAVYSLHVGVLVCLYYKLY